MYVTLLREYGLPGGALLRAAAREAVLQKAGRGETHVAVGLRSLAASGGCSLRAMRTARSLRRARSRA